ncbi:MAG: nitroreductase family protein [Proteobacteria bacterium]|nr:nitroreductase family protein [Pseudomonadota bacterium]MBU1139786.1 nitroreductase family protein [Pseudomonadota bacterium]MBU1234095.1 nitroreductase family protein [Pseudomonadota bacterium]MBU1418473.1 nitroreductase family protein [Pseudomonadota bacterium]MBU1453837.1 nitroreductase family protein [Pseudomonadota bacterium]
MFIDLLRKRRSIRQFQDKEVEQEKLELLIEAMLRAPSSRSLNPWEFVVVTETETIKALSRAKPHGAAFVKNAPLVIVVCADPEKCDVWIEDCSIASILLHLAATDLGLGSCWVQVRLREHDVQQSADAYVADILGLKEGMVVEAMIAIGYAAEEKKGHPASSLLAEKVGWRTE